MAGVTGSRTPRLGTRPVRELTPETSKGFALCDFAERHGVTFMPWQREAAIRALEVNPDGTYRFRTVLILVGRQSGKTTLLKMWALWRLLEDGADMVLGAAQALNVAREAWEGAVDLAERSPELAALVEKVRYANGQENLQLAGGKRYQIVASTRGAGRGYSADLLIMDEVREQRDHGAWGSLAPTTSARPHGQVVCISNAGDDESVVLNALRESALAERDESLCLLEWSAPDGCPIDDPEMWAMALPALGHTITEAAVRSALATEPPGVFRTERLCQHVTTLSYAIDPTGWGQGADPQGSVAPYRGQLTAGVDVALDGCHVALVAAAALGDGKVRVEPVASWTSTADARRELPLILKQLNARALAWFPGGPANALAPVLRVQKGAVEIKGADLTAACMGLADLVQSGSVLHNSDALLDGQVATASRLPQGDGFRFTRRGTGNCNALYACAGAVFVAQTAKPRRAEIFVA